MNARSACLALASLLLVAPVAAAQGSSGSISPRSCHAMTYVPSAGGVVVVGGARACGIDVLRDSSVWIWDGAVWKPVGAPLPSRREDALIAYDERRRVLVLYGGRINATVHRDTWEWSGVTWRQRGDATAPNPGPLEHAAAAYDARRGRVVVFGGGSRDGRMFDATWEWDGNAWRRADVAGPPARVGHSMAWSAADTAVLLYGGFNAAGPLRDLWKWSDDRWTRLDSAGPAPTEGPALVGSERGTLLVGPRSGGTAGSTPLGVWVWRSGRWTALSVSGAAPGLRVGPGVAWDGRRRTLVLFGGYFQASERASAETWEFDGSQWRLVAGAGR